LERFDIQNPNEYLGNLEAVAAGIASQQPGAMPAGMPMVGAAMGAGAMQPGMQGMPFPDPSQMGAMFGF
jgi:hypothetical protein